MPELRQHFNRPLESPASQLPTRNNSNSNDKNIINSQKQHFANDAYKVIDPKHQQSKDYSVSASDRTTTYLAILINRLIARNQFSQAIRASRFVDGRDKDLHKEIVKQCLDAHKLQAIHDYVDGNLSTMRSILFIIEARLISQLRLWEIHLRVDEPKQSQSRAKVKWSNGPKLSVMQGLEHAPHSLKLVEIAMSLVVRFGEENYLQKVPHIDLFYRYSTIVILLKGSGESSWQIPAASKPLSSSTPPKPNSSPRPIPMEEYD
ncbi:hypothetical protein BGW38_004302 [Lunasporangiospora selenospora]|uniref:Uncharacterized protein n=1 Tax=Lunasporangiospora selenospora TaxID=979761 RepID=A0A9P6G282_9FUNG|nr:hypothetical protein BGW38_004302 [Lunasporangiospora selenospora]